MISKAYELALAAHDAALATYRAATEAYYAGRIGDEEFSIARVAKRAADEAFDEAFDEASRWEWEDAERAADEGEYYDQFASAYEERRNGV